MKTSGIKKITLSIEAMAMPGEPDPFADPVPFEFIYGIGAHGLTPLERELTDKGSGDEVLLHIRRGEIMDFFGHGCPPFPELPENVKDVYLNIHVIEVSEAGQKEVIRAMAQMASCGDNCCGH